MSNAPRNTATRDRHRRVIARSKPDCGVCLKPIDYTLPHTDPLSFVVDHIIPLASVRTPEERAALDTLENKQACHRICNRAKSDTHPDEAGPRRYITWRTW